jgi:site-specific recombinase XerD
MPEAKFVLKEPTSSEQTLVYLIYRFNNDKLKYSTGIKIQPKLWNTEKQRAKELRSFKESSSINFLLDELEASVNNSYRTLLLEGTTPTPELLRTSLNQVLKKEDSSTKDLAQFAEAIIEASSRKEITKRAIRQTIRILNEFKEKTGSSLHFDAVDLDFYDKYLEYSKKQGYSQNSIGSQIKNIKLFMREAFERGLTKNVHFKSKRFQKLQEDAVSIYLTNDDLKQIAELDLSKNARLDKVRDLFLVGCNTGLRFSDLTQLSIESINKEKKIIKVRTQKTDETVVIPINALVSKIIEKYNGHLPTAISNVKMNAYLKEIGQEAELNEPIEIVSTKGGKRVKEVFKKWELITVHTARRSFATNAYLHQVPSISIMKITGHTTERSFLKYIKISQEDNANKLLNHPFFN